MLLLFRNFFLISLFQVFITSSVFAFWVWTPETNKWVNPKFAVKETPKIQLKHAESLYQAKDYKKAIDEFNKLINNYPKSKEAPEAQFFIGTIWEEQEKYFEAFKAYQKLIDKYPFSERAGEIVERQYKIGERLLQGDGKKGFLELVATNEFNVVDVFRAVIKNAPYGPYAAQAAYKIGLYLEEKQMYQEARDEFEKIVNDYPDSEWAKAAQFQIAVVDSKRSTGSQYDQKVTKVAVEEFQEFVKDNPDAQLSKKAQQEIHRLREKEAHNSFLIGHFYEKQKNLKAARLYYSAVVDEYKNTIWATKALEKIQEIDGKLKSK